MDTYGPLKELENAFIKFRGGGGGGGEKTYGERDLANYSTDKGLFVNYLAYFFSFCLVLAINVG